MNYRLYLKRNWLWVVGVVMGGTNVEPYNPGASESIDRRANN